MRVQESLRSNEVEGGGEFKFESARESMGVHDSLRPYESDSRPL